VSYVLNDRPGRRISQATRQRVLETAQALGYVPNAAAVALRSGRSKIVLLREAGQIPLEGQDLLPVGAISGLLRDAVAREVRSWGMTLVSCGIGFPLAELLGHLTPSLVLAPGGLSDHDQSALQEASIPWYGSVAGSGSLLDLMTGSLVREQVLHLRQRGHQRVGYIKTDIEQFSELALHRLGAFLAACRDAGIECAHQISLGPIDNNDCVEMCRDALINWHNDGVTAAAGFNDLYAGVALKACRRLGWQIPGTLAVIGVDDDVMSSLLDPPLTTVRVEMAALGSHLAACGRAVLDSRLPPPFPDDMSRIIVRSTT
jgi:DNA-binding LacI/PurR family transcriptional regulator